MKAKPSYTVDKEVLDKFNKVAKTKSLNKSLWVENKMKEYIEENDG